MNEVFPKITLACDFWPEENVFTITELMVKTTDCSNKSI